MAALRPSSHSYRAEHRRDSVPYTENLDINDTIMLNISGTRHEVLRRTLKTIPGTLLADLEHHPEHFREEKNEYFFDRHPLVFNSIINFYRTKELHSPNDICGPVFERELSFWGIDPGKIEQCCWIRYNADRAQKDSLDFLDHLLQQERDQTEFSWGEGHWARLQMIVWLFLRDPYSSKWAMMFAVLSFLLTVISITVFCMETIPGVRSFNLTLEHYADYHGVEVHQIHDVETSTYTPGYEVQGLTAPHPNLELIDMCLMVYFTLEIIFRFSFTPRKKQFFLDWINVVDIISVLPFYIELIAHAIDAGQKYENNILDALFVLKILRIFRVFRIMKHSKELKVLTYTMKASWKEFLIMTSFLMIGIVLFGSLIYTANHNEKFSSIPRSFWWAIVTMTTVGYGDMVPTTNLGYLIGAICTMTGVLVISFTVPAIVNNFLLFYNHVQYQREPQQLQTRNLIKLRHKPLDIECPDDGNVTGVEKNKQDEKVNGKAICIEGKTFQTIQEKID